jgi:5-methylcytosine-specific restriction endonuclease McrA
MATRERIMRESDGVCFYCGNAAITIDHVVPWSQGGSMHPMNLVAACTVCNSIAGERLFRDITDKLAYILARRAELERAGRNLVALAARGAVGVE